MPHSHHDAEFEAGMQKMRERFAANLPQRMEAIQEAWRKVSSGNNEALHNLYRENHSLIGLAQPFGFCRLSDIAISIEQALAPDGHVVGVIPKNLEDLRHLVESLLSEGRSQESR